jgi:adenine-specific DNA-methyltransferase
LTLGSEVDDGEERFGMTWPGKRDCFKVIQEPSIGTLKPCRDESVNWDKTENLFIEGDNLEVLKLFQKSYYGKVKVVCIDPPYNTGNEFIYPDKYSESLETYFAYTGQVDAEGRKFSTNTEADGRFHSKWLNMMYPRLFLARNLLRDDGVICVSIGDDEFSNLIALMNEIYGEENQVCIFTWKSRAKPTNAGNAKFRPQKVSEYVLVYSKKSPDDLLFNVISAKNRTYPHNDEEGNYRTTSILTSNRGMFKRETMRFEIGGFKPDEDYRWKAGYDIIINLFDRKRIGFNEEGLPFEKKYEHEEKNPLYPIYTFVDPDISGTAENGKSDLNEIIGNKHGLDTVKPVNLMRYLINTFSNKNDIILDFFAGSCTVAQALIELTVEDNNTNRKYICIQLPEKHEKEEAINAGFITIADIGKERIRRVIKKIQEELDNEDPISLPKPDIDLGFKVFKLDKSNFKIWDGNVENKPIQEQLKLAIDHIDPKSKEEDILYEILLKSGFELATPIEKLTIEGKKVYSVAEGALLICLEKNLTKELIRAIAEKEPHRVVCLDSGFKGNDQLKTNAVQIMKSFKVESFRTV